MLSPLHLSEHQVKMLLAGDAQILSGLRHLTRFFAIHVFFLPAALLGLMGSSLPDDP